MHGIKRTRLNPQAIEAKRLKEQAKIEAYVGVQDDVMARRKRKEYTPEALGRTTALLDLNPEFYTIWNYRREILLHGLFPASTAEEIVGLLTADLRLTTAYLQVHPKVYWIWNHRKWCLENVPPGPDDSEEWRNKFWKVELGLIEKMLDADARNCGDPHPLIQVTTQLNGEIVHAWSYRRYVLTSLPSSFSPKHTPRDELRYTQRKIEANFSNFSAWHCRTKVLGGLWEGLDAEEVRQQKDEEFELVRQALWTDPGDQSGWLYHRWLVGTDPDEEVLRKELASIQELHETEPDSKWCMNALAHYLLQLARLPSISGTERDASQKQARDLLKRLEEVDSDRKERYRDMAQRA